jgi:3',5'-cyclic AMP phosphodiesterase CpdA
MAQAAPTGVPLLSGVRHAILQHHGARAAERTLWRELLDTLTRTVDELPLVEDDELALIHTGDITQAGQIQSLHVALSELGERVGGKQLLAVPGNHDLWPEDFPPFSPGKTAHQFARIRNVPGLPSESPWGPIRLRSTLELLLFNSAVADSMLNTFALGKIQEELASGPHFTTRDPMSHPPAARLRGVVVHHPIVDFAQRDTRAIQQAIGVNVGMVLLDAPSVQQQFERSSVALVFCGHEHEVPGSPKRLHGQDTLLQLCAGSPTLWPGFGNFSEPQFSLYVLEEEGAGVKLSWYVCRLHPARWSCETAYRHAHGKWQADGRSVLLPSLVGKKARAPHP